MLHPVAGLRPTRRLKRPVHPDGHRYGVPQFAGVLSVQGPDALHNGGQIGAAPHVLVDEKAGEDVGQAPWMWRCRPWSTGVALDRPSSPPRERHANAPLRDCHISDTFTLRQPITYRYSPGMTTYGYIRTSRQRIQGTAGSDPEAQAHQLRQEGVPEANIFRDVGVSGGTGTNSRAGWRALDAQLVSGDILVVVAIDRIGRRWMDTVNAVRDLRTREVRIRSLAQSEATWVTYLAAEPDTAEAVIGDILTTFMAWAAEQELQAVSRRTRAGLERARAEGKTLGPPSRVDDGQVEAMARLRREGQSFRSIGRVFGVSRTTVQRRLQEQEAGNLEDSRTA